MRGVLRTPDSLEKPKRNQTRTEKRTKSFDKTYSLGSLNSSFYTSANARVRTEILVTTSAHTYDDDAKASASLRQFGFLANTTNVLGLQAM